MIDFELISVKAIIPNDEVRIVAMQPYIKFHSSTEEPYRWSDDAVDFQLDAIRCTLDIAQNGFSGRGANFTLFPEYAIPGKTGAIVIDERISENSWPNESIIIAGIHGIIQAEYKELCEVLNAEVSPSNAPDSVPSDKWVNCCVIWIKDSDGVLKTWLQPKIRPAWQEMNVTCSDMFRGSHLYVFECKYENGVPCNFISLICFDWVASVAGGTTVCHEFLEKLNTHWRQTGRPGQLHWAFVIQHNTKPNHELFLNSTKSFLTDNTRFPYVERRDAIVVHANTADHFDSKQRIGGGFSACTFSPSAEFDLSGCRPTVCMQPSRLRKSSILNRCKDVVFRELTECIHVYTVRVPQWITPDASDRSYPLPLAEVRATSPSIETGLCVGSVPASVKWVSDAFYNILPLSARVLSGCKLGPKAESIEEAIVVGLCKVDGHAASNVINWAACSFLQGQESRNDNRRKNADVWETTEVSALEHTFHSLTSLGLAYEMKLEDAFLHGTILGQWGWVDVVAIRGETHLDCRRHYDKFIPKPNSDPILVIVRDRENLTPTPEEFRNINESGDNCDVAFLDYQTLILRCRQENESSTLKGILDDLLPQSSRII